MSTKLTKIKASPEKKALIRKQINKNITKASELSISLSPGMTVDDYLALRDDWYGKLKDNGFAELERFVNSDRTLSSSYLELPIKASSRTPSNYSAIEYYDYLQAFYNHLDYIKSSQHMSHTYKIHRFFEPDVYESYKILLQCVLTGASYPACIDYLSINTTHSKRLRRVKSLTERNKLALVGAQQGQAKYFVGKNHDKIWKDIRLMHECCFQFLLCSGLVSIEALKYLDLTGLDSKPVQLFIADYLGMPDLKWSSKPASRHLQNIY